MTITPELSAIADAFNNTTDNLCLQACAGSGKTTTECWLLSEHIKEPMSKSILFLSFSKNIVEELVTRVPIHVQVKTFNALGHGVLQARIGKRLNVKADKLRTLMKDKVKDWAEYQLYANTVPRMVSLAKNIGIGVLVPNVPEEWFALFANFGLTLDSPDADESTAVYHAMKLLEESNAAAITGFCDFDDQLYLPILWKLNFQKWNIIFVDEAQDTNAIQREMVKRLVAPNGRVVIAGDISQAIYGFRGADIDSMRHFIKDFNMKVLPLSVSYRCSQSVVAQAQRYVTTLDGTPGILPHPDAPLGDVQHLTAFGPRHFSSNHAILCRNTAPLITLAFGLIQRGVGCKVLGREIGANLVTLIKKAKCTNSKELEVKLIQMRNQEIARAERAGEATIAAIEDKYDCLNIFLQHATSVDELCEEILELFDESRKGLLTLSTVHKSKGLEWPTTFILDFIKLQPSKWAKTTSASAQEKNLQYVAVTRAKLNLYFIQSGCWERHGADSKPQQKESTR